MASYFIVADCVKVEPGVRQSQSGPAEVEHRQFAFRYEADSTAAALSSAAALINGWKVVGGHVVAV